MVTHCHPYFAIQILTSLFPIILKVCVACIEKKQHLVHVNDVVFVMMRQVISRG